MSIKVKTNNNTTTVRVGQQNAIKVVASNKSAAALGRMQEVTDVNINDRTTNTLLMFNGTEYIHVPTSTVLDLTDGTFDGVVDYGSF